jgi:hypothetical protein
MSTSIATTPPAPAGEGNPQQTAHSPEEDRDSPKWGEGQGIKKGRYVPQPPGRSAALIGQCPASSARAERVLGLVSLKAGRAPKRGRPTPPFFCPFPLTVVSSRCGWEVLAHKSESSAGARPHPP